MKVNKWIIICSVLIGMLCIFLLSVSKDDTLIENVAISLLTGTIFSVLTSIIYYLNERQRILYKIKEAIPNIYINLKYMHDMMSNILPQVIYVQYLDSLNYRRLLELASLNMDFVQQCQVGLFAAFSKNGKTVRAVDKFQKYIDDLYNLKNCLGKLECIVLDADILQNQLYIKQINNQIILSEEQKLLCDKRNLVNIRTAKIHEYEASLLKELDDIAADFFHKSQNEWKEKKGILNQQVIQLFNEM